MHVVVVNVNYIPLSSRVNSDLFVDYLITIISQQEFDNNNNSFLTIITVYVRITRIIVDIFYLSYNLINYCVSFT